MKTEEEEEEEEEEGIGWRVDEDVDADGLEEVVEEGVEGVGRERDNLRWVVEVEVEVGDRGLFDMS